VVQLAPLAELPGEIALALATGNAARAYGLTGVGILEPGRVGDVILMDRASGADASSALETIERGDLPAITSLVVDGQLVTMRARNTPFTERVPAYSGKGVTGLRYPTSFEAAMFPGIFV
jgi:enamidase